MFTEKNPSGNKSKTPEKITPIAITEKEFSELVSARIDDPTLLAWMKKNNIQFNQGLITLTVSDQRTKTDRKVKFDTDKMNFGHIG